MLLKSQNLFLKANKWTFTVKIPIKKFFPSKSDPHIKNSTPSNKNFLKTIVLAALN